MSRGFGEYPVTTGAQATVTGLPEALTTTASSGVEVVAGAAKPHTYGRRAIG
jgi:hypothetical protein